MLTISQNIIIPDHEISLTAIRAQGAGGRAESRRSVDPDRAEPDRGARAPEGLGVGIGPRRPAPGASRVARG